MAQTKKWTRFRHKVIINLVRPFFALTAALKYHAKIDRFAQENRRNWLVLSNHQTDFDQFFLGLAFRQPLYYVAMEDLFSLGFLSRVIEWIVAPIPIMKAAMDLKAIKTCIRVAREGGSIALFPEGNRTYSGKTCYIKPGVASLAKKLGLPIAIFRIEGGYGVKPRWADDCRKGKMQGGVRRIIEPEEYQDMTKDELYELICRELTIDETGDAPYLSSTAAECLERVLYVCPDCGLSEFETKGDLVTCKRCGKQYRYRPDRRLEALDGSSAPRCVGDWYDEQEAYIRALDLAACGAEPLYTDTANLLEVVVYRKKQLLLKDAAVRLCADRLVIEGDRCTMELPFPEIRAMACIAGHKLNIFHNDKVYQLQGGRSFNALKYCNLYYHAKFIQEGHTDGEFQFLGL